MINTCAACWLGHQHTWATHDAQIIAFRKAGRTGNNT